MRKLQWPSTDSDFASQHQTKAAMSLNSLRMQRRLRCWPTLGDATKLNLHPHPTDFNHCYNGPERGMSLNSHHAAPHRLAAALVSV